MLATFDVPRQSKVIEKYWIRMKPCDCGYHFRCGGPPPNRLGFGVTAFNCDDAILLLSRRFPEIMATHELRDVSNFKSSLDVVTNIDVDAFPPFFAVYAERQPFVKFGGPWRGVWFSDGHYCADDHRFSRSQ